MSKLILLGLHTDPNLGDALISECTEQMVSEILCEAGACDIEPMRVDMRGVDYRTFLAEHEAKEKEESERRRYERELERERNSRTFKERFWKRFPRLKQLYGYIFRERIARERAEKEKRRIEAIERKKREFLDYQIGLADRCAAESINNDTAGVIIVGGGILKFSYQHLALYVEPYIRRAEELDIPVMLSAVGVEGYDELDDECCLFKRMLACPCVKSVTTRDDIATLRENYVDINSVRTALVADPACRADRLYERSPVRSDTIGLGIGRSNLFADHGLDTSGEQMLELWSEIIARLESKGKSWQLFTNGSDADRRFAVRLLEYLGRQDESGLLAEHPLTTKQLVGTITSYGGIIACRMHSAIIAHTYGIPYAELVWNDKQLYFGELAGTVERFISIGGTDTAERVTAALEAAAENKAAQNRLDTQATYNELAYFIGKYIIDKKGE